MRKRTAAIFFFGVTGLFLLVFVALTIHSHTRFPELTNADAIDEDVLAGKDVWHAKNCVNCHTLMGEGAYYAPDLTRITQHRGAAYLAQFMREPGRFYSEAEHGRLMTNPDLTDGEIEQVIAFLDWIANIDNFDWPPRPIMVSGTSTPGLYGADRPRLPASDDPVALGEALFRSTPPGCFTCHSASPGVTISGPSLAGLPQRAERIIGDEDYAGDAMTVEEYVRESILRPSAHIAGDSPIFAVEGRSVMPDNYGRTLHDAQVDQLVAYLMSLR